MRVTAADKCRLVLSALSALCGLAMSEALEQSKVVEWCKTTAYKTHGTINAGTGLVLHIPNGGWRSKSEAARLKAMGVRAGVSDLFLPIPSSGKHGLWIEMKAIAGPESGRGGVISSGQGEWLDLMTENGYAAHCCHGADEAINAIKEYMGL